jgi:SAM-dependent methyltransferase
MIYQTMHDTAYAAAYFFASVYGKKDALVVDIGGLNVNGSTRPCFEERNMKFICIDIEKHDSVDIVIKPGDRLPFEDGSVDIVVSTSCFEHDPCFWLTFKEMCRITKLGGYIYVNAPSNGYYHGYPGDGWRFYASAGQYLAFWASKSMGNEEIFPVKVLETFHVLPQSEPWTDWVCIWQRVSEKETEIVTDRKVVEEKGRLEHFMGCHNMKTIKKIE